MENRERDRLSQRSTPTAGGDLNRSVEQVRGRDKSGGSVEFGQNIGRSEDLEGGESMNRNRNEEVSSNKNLGQENESTRRSGQGGLGSSSGRSSGSSGSLGEQSSNIESEQSRRGSMGSSGNSGSSSSGRH